MYRLLAFLEGFEKVGLIKSKILVADSTDIDVVGAWNAERSVLMHDVHKGFPAFGNRNLLLVVEYREPLIAVQGLFVLLAHLPDSHRNLTALLLFDGQVGASLAPLEQ